MVELRKIGQTLRQMRENEGLSYKEAALKAGIAKSTVQRIEQGDDGVSLGNLFAYLSALGGSEATQAVSGHFQALPGILAEEKNMSLRQNAATALLLKVAGKR